MTSAATPTASSNSFYAGDAVTYRLIYDTLTAVDIAPRPGPDAADLFNGTLRLAVERSDKERDTVDEAKGMLHHEALDFDVVPTAPM